MTPSVRLAIWNIERRLALSPGDAPRSTPGCIITELLLLQADIIFIPESHNLPELPKKIRRQFEAVGYTVYECAYDDPARVKIEPDVATHSMFLTKFPLETAKKYRYDRHRSLPTICVRIDDSSTLTLVGIHLDDRSEAARRVQAGAIIRQYKKSTTPLVLLGDFNAMHKKGIAWLYGSWIIRQASRLIPHTFLRSVVERFSAMANGGTLRMLMAELGLRDADPYRHSTVTPKMRGLEFLPSIPLAQIDHILISDDIQVDDIEVMDDGGSDHRAVVATIKLDKREKI